MNEQLHDTHNHIQPQDLGYAMLYCAELSETPPTTPTDSNTVFETISEEVTDLAPRAGLTVVIVEGVTNNKDGSWSYDKMELSKEDD